MQDMIALVGPLIPALRRYARAELRDAAAADDLVQDCLERAVSRWGQRRADRDVKSWLFAILHNLVLDLARRSARRGRDVALDEAAEATLARPGAQEAALDRLDLMAALAALPAEQRSVVLLVGVEGLSYAEAAHALDVPLGTVMSRLSRGRDRLLRLIDPDVAERPAAPHLRRVQ